jgi:hypothetical protein
MIILMHRWRIEGCYGSGGPQPLNTVCVCIYKNVYINVFTYIYINEYTNNYIYA